MKYTVETRRKFVNRLEKAEENGENERILTWKNFSQNSVRNFIYIKNRVT